MILKPYEKILSFECGLNILVNSTSLIKASIFLLILKYVYNILSHIKCQTEQADREYIYNL